MPVLQAEQLGDRLEPPCARERDPDAAEDLGKRAGDEEVRSTRAAGSAPSVAPASS